MRNRKMRSVVTWMLVLLLGVSFSFPFFSKTVKAETTTYTVRVFSGERGSFSGKGANEVKVYNGLTYGSEFRVKDHNDLKDYKNSMTLTDERYYVRGIRESGKDNNTVGEESFKITRDIDFVVAYGIKGSNVEYYVNYVDESGNKLAESDTYSGNVGDKPVVAYEYIDGYYPQARNLTKTLSANASENNFTFVYRKITQETATTTTETNETDNGDEDDNNTTIIEYRNGNNNGTTNNNDNANNDNTNNDTANNNNDATASTAAPAGDTGVATTEDMPDNPDEVPDLVDIDDQETPLADFEGATDGAEETTGDVLANDNPRRALSTPVKIGIAIGAVAAIAAAAGALYYFLVYREDDGDDEEDEPDDDSEDNR